jgi:hypothetical protein
LFSRTSHTALLSLVLLLAACSPTKRVPPGEHLLKRNDVVLKDRSVPASELESIIKQKPNKKVLGSRFYLSMYNIPDPELMARRKEHRARRIEAINERRTERGKAPKPYGRTTGEWLREVVGEPPVLLDSGLTERSRDQMELYLRKEGWFNGRVSDTTYFVHRGLWGMKEGVPFNKPKAWVQYRVEPGRPYRIRRVRYLIGDSAITALLLRDSLATLVRSDERFDADVLDQERARITDMLRDRGYLFFNKDLLVFTADTAVGDHQVDLSVRLQVAGREGRDLGNVPETRVYRLEQVEVVTKVAGKAPAQRTDSVVVEQHLLLFEDRQRYVPKALIHSIFLNPGDRYRQSNADRSYRRLTGLRVFDRVEIAFDTSGTAGKDAANARITLYPGKEQSLALEGFGTNRGGFLGVQGSVAYRHRNLFRNMTSLQLQLTLGLEAQQSFTTEDPSSVQVLGGARDAGFFNTIDIGPELTVRFPHFLLPISRERFSRSAAPRTIITALYNFQQRPDFTRTLAKVSYGYEWQASRTSSFGVFPMEVNIIKIPQRSDAFNDYLLRANDPVLTDSYTDHLIVGMRGQYVYSEPQQSDRRNNFFGRLTLEWAGHPMGLPLTLLSTTVSDTSGINYEQVAGIRYAEFVKLDSDLRWLHRIHAGSSVAYRVAAGIGIPYGNLAVLPFESSFFVGGANGLRAWRARSLGPGSYSGPLLAFDRIGEIRLEANAEYRFKLISFLEGAFFADVGNIWNRAADPRRPGAEFGTDFLGELAVGTGVGARFNFDFFIVRFDLGLQTKDPALEPGERWLFQRKDRFEAPDPVTGVTTTYRPQVNFNLGIGYPF